MVRFPQLTDSDFACWKVFCDADFNEGFSRAEFVRSSRQAVGPTVEQSSDTDAASGGVGVGGRFQTSGDAEAPLSPTEKDAHPYSIMYSADR